MSNTLKSKKKPELQALAAELGIDTDGSKSDLEARILLYLSEHVELKSNSKFSKYFASITGPESPGPVASVAAGSHRRRSIAAKKSTELGDVISKALTSDEDGLSGAEIVKKGKRAATSVARTAEAKGRDLLASVPGAVPSPSRVSNQIELATSRLMRRARSASTSLQLHHVSSRVPIVRQAISNVVSVDGIVTVAELLLLLSKLIPRTYPLHLPVVSTKTLLHPVHGEPIFLPDLFKLLSIEDFWLPFLSWAFVTLALPLAFAYAFNLPSVASPSTGRRHAPAHSRSFDPITFAVTKALLVFAVFYRACPIIPDNSLATISSAIGGETLFLNSIIAFVYGLYDAILAHH